ncbi:trypsin-like peptidase domain-containing protein [Bacteroides heparinolyticus]|uniref:Putative heat shock-related protease n=1 Tax=Prevotella heparinolytica TaxID=28113 RepID=A0A449I5G0_9BACE|nr:trypsin-like peptidase domain-containing protein [Bacteroides heparinolyticus]MCI6211835.1 trypsin-like peptidase domain-containing protein [Bacteroides heparinolyticus]VFB14652.1 putative heat shock-related protease [Bacteroides heparinolyticus]
MKQTTKNILGVAAIVLLSSGVAGITTYKMLKSEASVASGTFDEMFEQNPDVRLASYSAAALQPVDLTQAAESSIHGVVHIRSTQSSKVQEVEVRDPFFDFFGDFFGNRGGTQKRQVQTPERTGFGSGVIISKDGYIVTNNHVIAGADEISVTLNDNRQFKGRIIGTDEETDLALIKIEGEDDFPTVPVGDSDALKVGEWVLAVGNPFNLTSTVTAGIVSAKARSLGMGQATGKQSIESYIQTDAAINQGNSGGALVNARGELVGINAALFSPTGSNTGYGFAIPTSIMKKVVADLKQYGTVQRVKLGVTITSLTEEPGDTQMADKTGKKFSDVKKEAREKFGVVDGLWVREIMEGSSAAGSDMKVDDVIVGMEGKTIHKFADLQELLAKHRPGDKVQVKVMRDKKEKTISVTLKNEQGTTKVVKDAGMEILGAAFKPISDALKKQLNLAYGLEVTGVTNGKMADAGIRKGFIILKANGQSVKTVDDLEKIMKEARKSPEQGLFITGMFPSGKRAMYAVDLTQE